MGDGTLWGEKNNNKTSEGAVWDSAVMTVFADVAFNPFCLNTKDTEEATIKASSLNSST